MIPVQHIVPHSDTDLVSKYLLLHQNRFYLSIHFYKYIQSYSLLCDKIHHFYKGCWGTQMNLSISSNKFILFIYLSEILTTLTMSSWISCVTNTSVTSTSTSWSINIFASTKPTWVWRTIRSNFWKMVQIYGSCIKEKILYHIHKFFQCILKDNYRRIHFHLSHNCRYLSMG